MKNHAQHSNPSSQIVVLGMPFDANSSFLRGAALAPARIRETLGSGTTNWFTEAGFDLAASPAWADGGDVVWTAEQTAFEQIEQRVASLLEHGTRVLALGGDHSITYPILRAYARQYAPLTIVHLDAHPDLYDTLDGNPYSHACPFARIMEAGLATRLIQIGIRTMNTHQRQQAERWGVEVIEMRSWRPDILLDLEGSIYLSLDLDVLDPAFAPGVSHHEPGGFSTRDVLEIVQHLPHTLVGADIVEFNPMRDVAGTTAMVAAKFYKEILGAMLQ